MPRPIWTGTLSFGLLNVPVSLMTGERKVDLSFRMLDSRNNARVRYERVNAETGEEVPWKDIVKAFEYDKGNYVVIEEEDLKAAAPEGTESVEVETFVDADAIGVEYFEKPYVLVPGKKAEKGYVLLREVLRETNRIGIARVVIRTREYLAAVMPKDDALLLMIMRYPQELVDIDEYKIPTGKASDYRVSDKELKMAKQLIESMAGEWEPDNYQDEFRARLQKVIEKRIAAEQTTTAAEPDEVETPKHATTNVVDFMSLLEESLKSNKRTPAKGKKKASNKKSSTKKKKKTASRKRA